MSSWSHRDLQDYAQAVGLLLFRNNGIEWVLIFSLYIPGLKMGVGNMQENEALTELSQPARERS